MCRFSLHSKVRFFVFGCLLVAFAGAADAAAPLIQVVKKGANKDIITLRDIQAAGPNGRLFVQTLTRDLDLSGWLKTGNGGSFFVKGTVSDSGSGIRSALLVQGAGKRFAWNRVSMGAAEIRAQAHQLSDTILKELLGETGNAQSKIVFVNRKGKAAGDLYMCDANGMAVFQITHDNAACVGPRWAPNAKDIYYTTFLHGYPEVLRFTPETRSRKPLAAFKGLNTGAAIAPDGRRAAIILSYQGNPELYVLDMGNGHLIRLTNTPRGSEASPCWSPDGSNIVYVSDYGGKPQLYIVNVSSRKSRRITFTGTENVNPDWNKKNQITYASKRGGGYRIYTMDANAGEASAKAVDSPYGAEHPSWAPDCRHIVCQAGGALYILDTMGDEPVRLFNIGGNWMSPCWSKR